MDIDRIITDGSSQNNHISKKVEKDYVNIDELSFDDLLVHATRYAEIVKFFDIENKENNENDDWTSFFLKDETVIITLIQKFDLEKIERQFNKALDFKTIDQKIFIQPIFTIIYTLASYLNQWHSHLLSYNNLCTKNFCDEIEGVISKELTDSFNKSISIWLQNDGTNLSFDEFCPQWNIIINKRHSDIESHNLTSITSFFQSSFYLFINAISYLKEVAPSYLKNTLVNEDHSPQTALYFTFAHLYKHAQDSINNFTQRHFEFYYNDILQVKAHSFSPNKVTLLFSPQKDKNKILIPKGFKFTGIKDENKKNLVYTSTKDLVVNSAKIEALKTLFLEKDRLISPEKDHGYVTGIKVLDIPVSDKIISENDDDINKLWPLFGAIKDKHAATSQNADTGMAIANSVFLMKEGKRTVHCVFKLANDSFKYLTEIITKIAENTNCSVSEAFYKVFKNMFSIHVTSEEGWYQVKNFVFSSCLFNKETEPCSIELKFILNANEPAILGYNPEIHGCKYETTLPIVRLSCDRNAYMYPYSLMKELKIESVNIQVAVKEVKELQLYNNHGQLNPNTPYNPFGSLPSIHSYLIIGAYELFQKELNTVDINIKWANLPKMTGGFERFYSGYNTPYNNDLFSASVTILEKRKWVPIHNNQSISYKLFDDASDTKQLLPDVSLKGINLNDHITTILNTRIEDYNYNLNAKNGYLKLNLDQPAYAFGHEDYPHLLTEVTIKNAKRKKPEPIPNYPYTPLIQELSLNYTASSFMNIREYKSTEDNSTSNKLYHVHPWGVHKIFPLEHSKVCHLLPDFQHQGNLFIGLSGCVFPTTLTLFFHLNDDATIDNPQHPLWFYLDGDNWIAIDKECILSDSTNNFLNTGIVTLSIPDLKIDTSHTLFSEDLFWLKISVDEQPDALCSIIDIKTQGTLVKWENDDNTFTHLENDLVAGSISKPLTPSQTIKEVFQPIQSYGGKMPEKEEHLYKRISERLSHKNRAVSAYDYERLILDKFPDIYKVKCFSNMSKMKEIDPGHILIVVIPFSKNKKKEVHNPPLVSARILNRIKNYVYTLCSPFVSIEVCNPCYEKIQVRCCISINRAYDGGYCIEMLNNELSNLLSPWSEGENNNSKLGKPIQCSDILAFIQNRNYIKAATDFSMLQITSLSNKQHGLIDTISYKNKGSEDMITKQKLHPQHPWSILVSSSKHFIKIIQKTEDIKAEPTGVDELEVGRNFIIE